MRGGGGLARLRVVHPYPSLLNALAVLVLAIVAGGVPLVALRLSLAMLALQFSIGAFNDLADAPRDVGRVPPKPIPSGLVSRSTARLVGILSAAAGLTLVAASGPGLVGIAAVGLGCGLAYDLGMSRTVVSWVPLAIALPLVVVFAWVGATGGVSGPILSIVPVGALAGGGLAIANALVDVDVDWAAGRRTVAVALGASRAWWLQALAMGAATAFAFALLPAGHGPAKAVMAVAAGALLPALILLRSSSGERRRLGWQVEAAAVVLLAGAWGAAAAGLG